MKALHPKMSTSIPKHCIKIVGSSWTLLVAHRPRIGTSTWSKSCSRQWHQLARCDVTCDRESGVSAQVETGAQLLARPLPETRGLGNR